MAFSYNNVTYNNVTLVGNLGRDAETKYTQSGMAVSNFSVATTRSWKDKQSGEFKNETTWTNCVMWGNEKLAPMLTKGAKVFVNGRLQTSSYDDKDGKKVYKTEVVTDNVILAGSNNGGGAEFSGDSGNGFEPPF
jgi:single-strand DNA-binding protein